MLNTFPLEELLYQGKFTEVEDGINELETTYPDSFYLSVFTSRYLETKGDYKKAIALAETNWKRAKTSGNNKWKISAGVPLLDIYWRKLPNLTKYFHVAQHLSKLELP